MQARAGLESILGTFAVECAAFRRKGDFSSLAPALHAAISALGFDLYAVCLFGLGIGPDDTLSLHGERNEEAGIAPRLANVSWIKAAIQEHLTLRWSAGEGNLAPEHEAELRSIGIINFAALPLHYNERFCGVFMVGTTQTSSDLPENSFSGLATLSAVFSATVCARMLVAQSAAEANGLRVAVDGVRASFFSFMDSLSEGIIMADREGLVTYCNKQMTEITGYPRDEIVGKHVYEVFFANSKHDLAAEARRFRERYKERLSGVSEQYELEITRKNGEIRWLEVRAAPLRDSSGEIIGSIGMNIEITERKQLETQLRWSQKMEAVGRLAGGIAHDFNNLLTVISGYAKLLLKEFEPGSRVYRKIDSIRSASDTACSLTQQLLTLSRRQVVQPRVFNLNEVLSQTFDILRGLLGPNIGLCSDLTCNKAFIKIDPGQLQQVVLNLAINARDSMPKGGTLHITTDEKILSTFERGQFSELRPGAYVVLTVRDTGGGMSDHVKAHLFEPFFTTKGNGSGLGLSTVYGIVRQHEGFITVSSELDRGSTFSVYFPKIEEVSEYEVPLKLAATGVRNGTILVVEDENEVRKLVTEVLELRGYTVLSAESGQEALAILSAEHVGVELLLTDVIMPHMNGFELTEIVLSKYPQTRVLMISGCTADSTIPESITKRGIPFLAKPFSPEALVETVERIIGSFEEEADRSRISAA